MKNLEKYLEEISSEIISEHARIARQIFVSNDLELIKSYDKDSRTLFEKYGVYLKSQLGYKPASTEVERDAIEMMRKMGEVSVASLASERGYGRSYLKGVGVVYQEKLLKAMAGKKLELERRI